MAARPRTQAKLWLLMDDLVDRYLLGIGHFYVGTHRAPCLLQYTAIEDYFCSTGEPGLASFAINQMEPCEAQARGFTHGHRKAYGIPEPMGPEMLRQFELMSAAKPDAEPSQQCWKACTQNFAAALQQHTKCFFSSY